MKKILMMAASLLLFACDNTSRTTDDEHREHTDHTTEESMDKGSGTDISPQLEESDRREDRLTVDTISAADAQ